MALGRLVRCAAGVALSCAAHRRGGLLAVPHTPRVVVCAPDSNTDRPGIRSSPARPPRGTSVSGGCCAPLANIGVLESTTARHHPQDAKLHHGCPCDSDLRCGGLAGRPVVMQSWACGCEAMADGGDAGRSEEETQHFPTISGRLWTPFLAIWRWQSTMGLGVWPESCRPSGTSGGHPDPPSGLIGKNHGS